MGNHGKSRDYIWNIWDLPWNEAIVEFNGNIMGCNSKKHVTMETRYWLVI